jgi:hypothetical protein
MRGGVSVHDRIPSQSTTGVDSPTRPRRSVLRDRPMAERWWSAPHSRPLMGDTTESVLLTAPGAAGGVLLAFVLTGSIVDQAFVRRFFPNIEPLGQRCGAGPPQRVVTRCLNGVVSDAEDEPILDVTTSAHPRPIRCTRADDGLNASLKFVRRVVLVISLPLQEFSGGFIHEL